MVYPLTTGFHWGALDFQWYIEGSVSRNNEARTASGYHDVQSFISHPTHPGTDFVSIPDFVEARSSGVATEGTTPLDVALRIEEHADRALEGVGTIHPRGDFDLWQQLEDIRAMACLGKHYAHKIRAATEIALHRATNAPGHRLSAVRHARMAALYWRTYVSYLSAAYQSSIWFNRLGEVDWKLLYFDALHDVLSVGGQLDVPSMETTAGGTILEAEDGRTDTVRSDDQPGFTGTGYLSFSEYGAGDGYVEWAFEAPAEGRYVLEVRYSARTMETRQSRVLVDGEEAGTLGLWGTGGWGSWCWDRTTVALERGRHGIRLYPHGDFRIDHLNVLPID
jgi:hypothetical protein